MNELIKIFESYQMDWTESCRLQNEYHSSRHESCFGLQHPVNR